MDETDIIVVQPMAPVHALSLFEKKLGLLDQGDNTAELAAALIYTTYYRSSGSVYFLEGTAIFRIAISRRLPESDRKKTSLLNHEGGQLRRDWQARNSIIITWQILFEHIVGIL